jgi:hypothetical protein
MVLKVSSGTGQCTGHRGSRGTGRIFHHRPVLTQVVPRVAFLVTLSVERLAGGTEDIYIFYEAAAVYYGEMFWKSAMKTNFAAALHWRRALGSLLSCSNTTLLVLDASQCSHYVVSQYIAVCYFDCPLKIYGYSLSCTSQTVCVASLIGTLFFARAEVCPSFGAIFFLWLPKSRNRMTIPIQSLIIGTKNECFCTSSQRFLGTALNSVYNLVMVYF